MKTLKVGLFFAVMLFASSVFAQDDCYVGVSVGRSSIAISGIEELEERAFLSDYSTATFDEKRSSTTGEIQFGCSLSEDYGFKAEIGVLEGFEHFVRTDVTVSYGSRSEKFSVDRLVEARGYMLSGILESQLSEKTFVFFRVGALYAKATADAYLFDSEYSVHAKREGFVPVFGLGGRFKIDDRWSGVAEYRLIGHQDVRQALLTFQYSFKR